MKVIILAGGFGTRLMEETVNIPKAIVKIGDKPILWHVMNVYAAQNITEFIIALGYKGNVIKNYFHKSNVLSSDVSANKTTHHSDNKNNWTIHLVDTGLDTMTGGRLKRLKDWVKDDDIFLMTYGDGVADINIRNLLEFHNSHGKLATVTAVNPPERFGRIIFNGDNVTEFNEKPKIVDSWINGGFFVLNPEVLDYIEGDQTIWERDPIEKLVQENQLMGYKHRGFWGCMDTPVEREYLEDLWNSGEAPWKIW